MGARERASTNGNTIQAMRPMTPAIGAARLPLENSSNAKTIPASPTLVSSTPGKSILRLSPSAELSGTRQRLSAMTTIAMGKLMKNTQRQETNSTIQPPSTGPKAAVIAVNPDQVPIARPRSSDGNDALISARLPGTSNAPPTPWNPRATIRWRMSGAKPHHTDAAAKRVTPIVKIRRRP